jgi:hypothetical protein
MACEMKLKPRQWYNWPYFIWNYRKIKKLERMVEQIMTDSKGEIDKIFRAQVVFGQGEYEIVDGKVRHIPYRPFGMSK